MKAIQMPDGTPVPMLGQGSWKMGEGERPAKEDVAALRLGIDLGMTLIDTAEMYGDRRSEEVVGQSVAGQRERVFVVTNVYPQRQPQSAAGCRWAQFAAVIPNDR